MAPFLKRDIAPSRPTQARLDKNNVRLEAWIEGVQLGSLMILMLIIVCNIRRKVLLHKLILIEQFLAVFQCVVIFFPDPAFGWYCSSTVMLLYISYFLHNFVSWLKIRPFLERRGSILYVGSLILVQPYWIAALWTNFELFNGSGNYYFRRLRPIETFARDPWWIFVTGYLFWVLKTRFDRGVFELIAMSPRFGVMIACMFLSMAFLMADVGTVFADLVHTGGGNPYWRFALIFKCASDTIFLDDFKRVFDILGVNATRGSTENTLVTGSSNLQATALSNATDARHSLCQRCGCVTSAQKVKDPEKGEMDDIEEIPTASGSFEMPVKREGAQ